MAASENRDLQTKFFYIRWIETWHGFCIGSDVVTLPMTTLRKELPMVTSFARSMVSVALAVAATFVIVAGSAAPLNAAPHAMALTVSVPR
jgi:hypothetical protein